MSECINYSCDMARRERCKCFNKKRYYEFREQGLLRGVQIKRKSCNRLRYGRRSEDVL